MRPLRVMVVDDEEDIRDGLMALLKTRGYGVMGACDGLEALRRIDYGDPPDLFIIDLIMPVMTGFELLREIRRDARLRDIPVVVVSATDLPPALSAEAYFQKPYGIDSLLNKVAQLSIARSEQRFRHSA